MTHNSEKRVVVIDGPAGAGKSTAARRLAVRLDAFYLDTGAMYRACTLRALRLGVDLTDTAALAEVVKGAKIELIPHGEGCRVELDGEDVTKEIRAREVTSAIYHLADCPEVRAQLVSQQRQLAEAAEGSVVAEGRDLGSVVYPDADLKIYLDATTQERARRRLRDLGDAAPSFEELKADIEFRDDRDRSRPVGPLVQVPDAIYVDTSEMTLDQVIEHLAGLVADSV